MNNISYQIKSICFCQDTNLFRKYCFMKINFKIISFLCILCLHACENEEEFPIEDSCCYFPLAIGNYWIYDIYEVNSNGTEKLINQNERFTITKDTLINDLIYYIYEGYDLLYKVKRRDFLRESSGNIIQNKKYAADTRILLSYTNFKDTLYREAKASWIWDWDILDNKLDTMYTIFSRMEPGIQIKTSSYSFEKTINCKLTYFVYPKYQIKGFSNERYLNTYYADQIGEVTREMAYISSPDKIYQRRLVGYNIIK